MYCKNTLGASTVLSFWVSESVSSSSLPLAPSSADLASRSVCKAAMLCVDQSEGEYGAWGWFRGWCGLQTRIPVLQALLGDDGTALEQGHDDNQGEQGRATGNHGRDPGSLTITEVVPGAVFATDLDNETSDETEHKAHKHGQQLFKRGWWLCVFRDVTLRKDSSIAPKDNNIPRRRS